MKERWVLVLGAGSDIAVATARRFAGAGYNLYLASRNVDEWDVEVRNLALRYNVRAKSVYFDALEYDSHPGFYRGLDPRPFGTVLSYGVLGDQAAAQRDFSHARLIMETNYLSAVSILEIIAADRQTEKEGFIVGISSVAGDRGRQSNYIYGSAKAGFSAYLSGLRHRMHPSGVTVLTVKPGFVDTKMTQGLDLPEKLTARPEEVAKRIYGAVRKGKETIYVKPVWRAIMLVIVHLPMFVFNRTRL